MIVNLNLRGESLIQAVKLVTVEPQQIVEALMVK